MQHPSIPLRTHLPVREHFKPEYLQFYGFLPLALSDDALQVAITASPCQEALEDLSQLYGRPLVTVDVPRAELDLAIQAAFASRQSVVDIVNDLEGGSDFALDESARDLTDVRSLANEPPVIRFVNTLIREAAAARASDIHLEGTPTGIRIRLRIDGALSDVPSPPAGLHSAIISRLKILAELDIAERRLPQDGRMRVRLDERELDVRVATLPTLYGESVVLRLLDRGGRPIGLDELGMSPELLKRFRRLALRPHGILLATGPTGSGKTTSLYAALALRDASVEKIVTVEDPVEYHLPNIAQVPVRAKAGMTFSTALRSILRQDPDILMIGEMRDRETAEIAVQSAMTGHLVFSTLHTNDSIGALTRLADLGVEPYMIAASLEGVVAQRLVRRNCPHCSERYRPDSALLDIVGQAGADVVLERGRGCAECRDTGFRGRIGLFELLVVTEPMKDAISRRIDTAEIRALAEANGTRFLLEDAWTKARAGLTTLEEVIRVTGS